MTQVIAPQWETWIVFLTPAFLGIWMSEPTSREELVLWLSDSQKVSKGVNFMVRQTWVKDLAVPCNNFCPCALGWPLPGSASCSRSMGHDRLYCLAQWMLSSYQWVCVQFLFILKIDLKE